jgi:5-methylcytosine-specific restriction endonuclease McrA
MFSAFLEFFCRLPVIFYLEFIKPHIASNPPPTPDTPSISLAQMLNSYTGTTFVRVKPKPKRKPIPASVRFRVLKRDKFTCRYCSYSPLTDPIQPPTRLLEVDHIISVYDGGSDDESNLITACLPCNRGKGKDSVDFV